MAHVSRTFTRRQFVQATAAGSLALAGVGFGRAELGTSRQAEHRLHHGGRPRLCRRELLRPARLHDAEYRPSGDRGTEVHAGLFEFRELLADAHRADHRALSNASRGGPRGTDHCRDPQRRRPAAEPSDPSIAAQESGLRQQRWSANGTWAICRTSARSRAATTTSSASSVALRTISITAPNRGARCFEQEVPVDRVGYMTNLLGDRAVQTIEGYARSKEPFLLSLHFTAPHWPWEGPDDEAESKRIKGRLKHRDGGTQKTYMAMVQSLDANIGRVLQALDVNGLAGNTIVIFTSDNGGERFSKIWPFTRHEGRAS